MITRCRAVSTLALFVTLNLASVAQAQDDISYYCGGGFTGGGGGVTIKDDGEITSVGRRGYAAPLTSTRVKSDREAYRGWSRALDAARFDDLSIRQVGNLTCSLSRTHGGARHSVSWISTKRSSRVPEPVARVARELAAAGS